MIYLLGGSLLPRWSPSRQSRTKARPRQPGYALPYTCTVRPSTTRRIPRDARIDRPQDPEEPRQPARTGARQAGSRSSAAAEEVVLRAPLRRGLLVCSLAPSAQEWYT